MKTKLTLLVLFGIMLTSLAWAQANPARNLTFALENENDIHLTWSTPAVGNWVFQHVDVAAAQNSIGLGGSPLTVAQRFAVTDLTEFVGRQLTMLQFYPTVPTATYTFKIWRGGSQSGTTATPGTLVTQQAVTAFVEDEWNTVNLNQPVTVAANQELWIGYTVSNYGTGDIYPAACDDGPPNQWKGDLVLNGGTWTRLGLAAATLQYNWIIKGFLETTARDEEPVVLAHVDEYLPVAGTLDNLVSVSTPNNDNDRLPVTRDLLGYKLYRNGIQVNDDLLTFEDYVDADRPIGYANYYVVAVWDEGESQPSNTVQAVVVNPDAGNNTPAAATSLSLPHENAPYQILNNTDVDWYKFQVEANTDIFAYTTLCGGSALDTEMFLYGPANENGGNVVPTTWVATDDNTGGNNQPRILYHATQGGWYFVRIAFNGTNPSRDDNGFYSLTVRNLGAEMVYPPRDFNAEISGLLDVSMTWNAPPGLDSNLHWDNGAYASGIGIDSDDTWFAAIRFSTADLMPYHGQYLTQVSFCNGYATEFTIKIWQGGTWNNMSGTEGTVVLSQAAGLVTAEEWTTVTLSTPVQIDASQEMWIGYEVLDLQAADTYPAAMDEGPCVNRKGNLANLGGGWESLFDANPELNGNWNISGIVSATRGNLELAQPLLHQDEYQNTGLTAANLRSRDAINPVTNSLALNRALTGFKVYRDGTEIANVNDPTLMSHLDMAVAAGPHVYYVTGLYTGDEESYPSNTDVIDIPVVSFDPPTNLHGTVNRPNVILQWDLPARNSNSDVRINGQRIDGERPPQILSWKIYRNGNHIGTQNNPNTRVYMVANLPVEVHEFQVTAVYEGNNESDFSNTYVVDFTGTDDPTVAPLQTALNGISPNPFNPTTTVNYTLKENSKVQIDVMNIRGQKVRTLVNATQTAGTHSIVWDGKTDNGQTAGSGVFFLRMNAGDRYTSTKKMVLLK